MQNKKTILKKYMGKGGKIKDTIKEIPGTLKKMAKNLSKAVDPAQLGGKAVKAIKNRIMKNKVQSYVKPVAKPIPGRVPGEKGFEIIKNK
ncbi:MAG: hypothetical protein AABY22_35880 [Nanoarchaeota archaeon]